MITRGAPEPASAPNSPSSRTNVAPSDSKPPAAGPDVVDVTGGGEPWMATPRGAPEARKGKKTLTKHPAGTGESGTATRKNVREATKGSETDVEERAVPPPAKKARKILASVTSTPAADLLRHAGTRAEQGFNLNTFLFSFNPGLERAESVPADERGPVPAAPSAPTTPDVLPELQALLDEVMRLRGIMGGRGSAGGNVATHTDVTAPNVKGELPPPELRYLTNASSLEGSKKAKGGYSPPQTHLLTANRVFRAFSSGTGNPLFAMSFVLWLRELDCVMFQATPAVLMAILSGRLRSRGRMLMHFKESSEMVVLEEGSTNANFANDFSASATLPPTSISCSTLEDILNALGQEQVRLTLLYANKFLGAVLGHQQADDPR
ncbi:hypothetical protein BBJ29_008579 [Phytophthora kernoviae]|uniref:Uncharacterized protein n=1 Tax=Phytophthora kernoviae TaxID=325452 RepID=A0A3F2RAW0_9STRA|nr:hypothetical protein BBP00_00010022 [Phytophthora kernoviae]RLN50715.1 hypothetical protein BBJ29_008579 [Phytophthora kernoviae]